MTRLILAEKPSQAMDIARAVGIRSRGDGLVELVDGNLVSWSVGHLLELVEPQEYEKAWGERWSFAHLPMVPQVWKTTVIARTLKQFRVVQGLLKKVQAVVIATDAGREGELIARDILEYCRFRGDVKRLWTSSLVAKDIRAALDRLLSGAQTLPLYEAATARRNSDWLAGLSRTRTATLVAGH